LDPIFGKNIASKIFHVWDWFWFGLDFIERAERASYAYAYTISRQCCARVGKNGTQIDTMLEIKLVICLNLL
jgi:hypothetical protein